MQRIIAYIDGHNFYHGLRDLRWERFYWLNYQVLARKLLRLFLFCAIIGALILSGCVAPPDLGLQRIATASPRPDPPTQTLTPTPTPTATVTLTATRTITPTLALKTNATPTRTRTPISQQLIPPFQTKPPVATIKPTVPPTRQPTLAPTSGAGGCCKTCGPNSKACGDSCIALSYNCTKPPGCACNR